MITHKFREVMAFADAVSVLRRGTLAGEGRVAELTPAKHGRDDGRRARDPPVPRLAQRRLRRRGRTAPGHRGPRAWRTTPGARPSTTLTLAVRPGEIVGIAGVSGNGQRELVEALIGQRPPVAGEIRVGGQPYHARRAEIRDHARVQPARGAVAQRVRPRHERGREHGPAELRPGPAGLGPLAAAPAPCAPRPSAGSASSRSRPRAPTRRSPRSRAATCSARSWPGSCPSRRRC